MHFSSFLIWIALSSLKEQKSHEAPTHFWGDEDLRGLIQEINPNFKTRNTKQYQIVESQSLELNLTFL